MFCIIGVLAAAAAVFPEDGISVGTTTLHFPTLNQVLNVEQDTTPAALTPEQLLAQRAEEMRIQEEQEYVSFFMNNPARIQWPQSGTEELPVWGEDAAHGSQIGNYAYFDSLFAAFDHADSTAVRVVHYGDSQIEEDRISCVLRRELQKQFGGMGVGLVPLYQTVQSLTISQQTSREPRRYMAFGLRQYRRENSRLYGPMAQMAWVDTALTVSISARQKQTGLYSAHYFDHVTLLTGEGNISAHCKGVAKQIAADGSALQLTDIQLPDSSTAVSISLSGNGAVYGMSLSGKTGVNVDNIPLRGCSGTIFSGINSQQLSSYFKHSNTRLIIMQFGGNSMPYMKTEAQVNKYVQTLLSQVKYMQRQAPQAVILFIGPSDMTTRLQGKMQTYPMLPYFDRTLAQTLTTESGVAYWSLFETMGGTGSMSQWVRSGYAAGDYIHFTRKGANEVGEMLYNAINTAYKYYHWREDTNATVQRLEGDKYVIPISDTMPDTPIHK